MGKDDGRERLSGFLDKDTLFTGEIRFSSTLRIDGTFEGKIFSSSTLLIGETGRVKATIDVGHISINGQVEGTVKAKGKVEIFNKGRVSGTIITPKLMIEEGAFFEGECRMQEGRNPELPKASVALEDKHGNEEHRES